MGKTNGKKKNQKTNDRKNQKVFYAKKNQKVESKKRINAIILLLAFVAIMLVVSTYAWFSTQKNVSVTNLGGTVQVAEGMEISLDGDHFKQTLDLSKVNWTVVDESAEFPVYNGNTNNIPEELQPVSAVGTVAGTMKDVPFYKGEYTADSNTLKNVLECSPAITDATSGVGVIQKSEGGELVSILPGDKDYPGYFAFDVFIKSTIQNANGVNYGTEAAPVYGTPLQLNFDSFAKILEKVTGDGNYISTIDWENNLTPEELEAYTATGLQNTLRIGFAVYDKVGSSVPTTGSVVAATVEDPESKIRQMAIWEPNSAWHVEQIVSELQYSVLWDEDAATAAGHPTYNEWGETSKINTYGVTGAALEHNLIGVYKWDGRDAATANYVGIQNTVKTTPLAIHADPDNPSSEITGYNYDELEEGVTNLYDTSVDITDATATKSPFWIRTNSTSRVRVFVWMEGQDVDTRNIASMGHGILVNVDLTTGATVGSHGEEE